jgi:hypothetical protein
VIGSSKTGGTMTVEDLIMQLATFPKDMEVLSYQDEMDFWHAASEPVIRKLQLVKYEWNDEPQWTHSEFIDNDLDDVLDEKHIVSI